MTAYLHLSCNRFDVRDSFQTVGVECRQDANGHMVKFAGHWRRVKRRRGLLYIGSAQNAANNVVQIVGG